MSAGVKKLRSKKVESRTARQTRVRRKVQGTTDRPRLSVFRSAKHIYVQVIDDSTQQVIAAASDLGKAVAGEIDGKKKKERAKLVGQTIAKKLMEKNVKQVVFDRNGFMYHGRVQAVAEGAREGGLEF